MTVIKGSDVQQQQQQQQQPCIITHNYTQRSDVSRSSMSRDHAPAIQRTGH